MNTLHNDLVAGRILSYLDATELYSRVSRISRRFHELAFAVPRALMAAYGAGVRRTFVYELLDEKPERRRLSRPTLEED